MRLTLPMILGAAVLTGAGYLLFAPAGGPDPSMPKAARGGSVVPVTVPELTGNAVIGQRVFAAKCAQCHGDNGAGTDGSGPPLIHPTYRAGHHGDQSFVLAARNGVKSHHWPFGDMQPVEGISESEVLMVVEFIRAVQQANGIN